MKKVNELSLKEKVGQILMLGFDGTNINDDLVELIKKYKIGNVILFTRNIKSKKQLFKLTSDIQKIALKEIGIPMFISIDQEGGMVFRIPHNGINFPGSMSIAATNDVNNAYLVGKKMGDELNYLGINMNLAPIYDVNVNHLNPVIGIRSYSDDPNKVAMFANSFSKGIQDANVIATAKHFPGHGDTSVDSHLALPVINHDLKRLNEVEFKPFKLAIKNKIKAIMSSHINFTKLANENLPATLSKHLLTNILRDEFKFEGLIISDDMGMKGISSLYSTPKACVIAINAGVNIVCVCHPNQPRVESFQALYDGVISGEINENILNERVDRILKFKENIKINENYDDDIVFQNSLNNEKMSLEIIKKSLTLVKGNKVKLTKNALYIGIKPSALTIAEDEIKDFSLLKPIYDIKNLEVELIETNPNLKEINEVLEKARNFKQIIFATSNANTNLGQIDLIEKIYDLKKDFHVISLRNPYDLYCTKKIDNYVALYEYTKGAMITLSKYLKGEIEPKGVLPITILN